LAQNLQAAFFDLGGAAITELLKPWDEPIFPCMRGYVQAAGAGEGDLGPTKMRKMTLLRNELQKAYLDRWNATATADGKPRMDGIICATSPWAAPRLGQTQQNLYVGWTGFVNYLGKEDLLVPIHPFIPIRPKKSLG
jgi:amidase